MGKCHYPPDIKPYLWGTSRGFRGDIYIEATDSNETSNEFYVLLTYGTNTRGEDKCTYLWPQTGIEFGTEPIANEKEAYTWNQFVRT